MLITDSTIPTRMPAQPAFLSTACNGPATPAGFSMPGTGESFSTPGAIALLINTSNTLRVITQSTGRPRDDSGRPSGNTRNSSGGTPTIAGRNTHVDSQAAVTPPA